MSELPQQPRDVGDILSASLRLYTESFTKVIGYSLIIFALDRFFEGLIAYVMPVDPTLSTEDQMAARMQVNPVLLITISIADFLFYFAFYAAALYRIDSIAKRREDDFIEVLLLSLKKVPAVILAGILYAIAITIGTILLVVPGIILMVSLTFCWNFIVFEDLSAYDSLMASHRLVWGDWWRTNIVFFIPSLVLILFLFLVDFVGAFAEPTSFSYSALDIGFDLLAAIVTPYFFVLGYLQYHDLKLRKNL